MDTPEQYVILVNEEDQELGIMEKMEAHKKGLLHRAFSVFIFDKAGRMLLQQRAATKYHGGLLWTNACCSHPLPGEPVEAAATRRLQEELGFTTALQSIFSFTYRSKVENDLTEHEFDHVFAGIYEGEITPDSSEVANYQYHLIADLENKLQANPHHFTVWFRLIFPRIKNWYFTQLAR